MRPAIWTSVFVLLSASLAAPALEDGSEAFYNAIRRDDFAAVDRLLKLHGPNLADNHGSTPLMYAAAVGSEAMMRHLIQSGADAKVRNAFDASALHWSGGELSRMTLLVNHGADVNLRSRRGRTPLLLAASQAGGLAAVRMLIGKGATLAGPPAKDGKTPLAAAAEVNDTELMEFLIEAGGDAVLAPPGGPMALLNAALFGNHKMVKALLAKGVDVNSTSPPETFRVKNGPIAIGSLTPLILSAASGDTAVVRTLIEAGARVNAQDVRGMTPLMLAVATDHPNREIVRLLLQNKADTTIRSKAGETALDWALKFKDPSIIAAVRAASPGVEPARPHLPAPAPSAAPNALAAVRRSLPLLQKATATMFTEGGCVSCHGGNIVSSAVASVRNKGVPIDETRESESLTATRRLFAIRAEGFLEREDGPAVEILTYALAGLADAAAPPDRTTDAMLHNIAAQQLASGHWLYRGIARPPTNDHLFTNAAFAIRSFRAFAPPARKAEYELRIARAARALEAAEPLTTEDHVMRLLGLQWAGAAPASIERSMQAVLALQSKNGGWAQTPLHPPDAYATGTALYALFEAGLSPQSPQARKGLQFLLQTQAADGSWYVASRAPKFQPYFEGGFPYGHDQWISQWATGWAAIALARALPAQVSGTPPSAP